MDAVTFPDTIFYTERITRGGFVVKKAYYSAGQLKQAISYHGKDTTWKLIVAYNTNPHTAVLTANDL